MLPVITILGLQFGFALGGLVVVEAAFNLPGAGRFLLDATIRRDYNVVQASLFSIAIFVTAANLNSGHSVRLAEPPHTLPVKGVA